MQSANARCASLEARAQEASEAGAVAGATMTTQPTEVTALVESLLKVRLDQCFGTCLSPYVDVGLLIAGLLDK